MLPGETKQGWVMGRKEDPGSQADQGIVGEVHFLRLVYRQDGGARCFPHRLRNHSGIMMVHRHMDDRNFHRRILAGFRIDGLRIDGLGHQKVVRGLSRSYVHRCSLATH